MGSDRGYKHVPDLDNLPDVVLSIGLRGNDERPVEQVDGDSMGALVLGAAYPGDATVGSHDDDRSEVGLEGAVEEGKALNVE
jgi:hypothetical protein